MARSKAESALTLHGHVSATLGFKLTIFDWRLNIDDFVKSLFTRHFEESRQGVTTKQSPHFEQLHPMRLLRYGRNDCISDFLRNHQYCPCDT